MKFFLFTHHLGVFISEEVILMALSVREFRILKIPVSLVFAYQMRVNKAESIFWER